MFKGTGKMSAMSYEATLGLGLLLRKFIHVAGECIFHSVLEWLLDKALTSLKKSVPEEKRSVTEASDPYDLSSIVTVASFRLFLVDQKSWLSWKGNGILPVESDKWLWMYCEISAH